MKKEYYEFELSNKDRERLESEHNWVERPYELGVDGFTREDVDIMYDQCSEPTDADISRFRAAVAQLTEKQQQIVQGLYEGKTQQTIADELGVCQATVCLTINGANGYGGILKRLKVLIKGKECSKCGLLMGPGIADVAGCQHCGKNKNKKECVNCNGELGHYRSRYCGKECKREYRNRKYNEGVARAGRADSGPTDRDTSL